MQRMENGKYMMERDSRSMSVRTEMRIILLINTPTHLKYGKQMDNVDNLK